MAPDSSDAARPEPWRSGPTRATVWIEGAPVTILPRRAPVGTSGPIRGRTLAVFPYPGDFDGSVSDAVLEISRLLQEALPPDRWHEGFLARVEPGNRPAQTVTDVTADEAAAAGTKLGLAEILFWDGRRAHLLPCIAAPTADEPPASAPRG